MNKIISFLDLISIIFFSISSYILFFRTIKLIKQKSKKGYFRFEKENIYKVILILLIALCWIYVSFISKQ